MKQITLYEHDRLTTAHEYLDQARLESLLKFNEYHGGKYFEGIARGIKLKQFVGIIQVDDLTIEILPKIDRNKDDVLWRGVLLQMLQATNRLKVQTAGAAHVTRQNLNLLEIYFELFLNEVEYLIRTGLVKKYSKYTANVKALKGKLDFAGNIRHNLVHKERFYTKHQVYNTNHEIHQILNEALKVVGQFTNGTRLSDLYRRVSISFPAVDSKNITEKNLTNTTLDRKSQGYVKALEIARLILLNYSPDIKSGQEKMLSLLFDMNVLWEEYILSMLKKSTKNSEVKVNGQTSKKFWGQSRTIRPDILIEKGDEVIIIDTKWKKPQNRKPSIEDLRQMYAYSRFWKTDKVVLLYPGDVEDVPYTSYQNEHDEIDHQCKISFVSVLDGNNKLNPNIGIDILNKL